MREWLHGLKLGVMLRPCDKGRRCQSPDDGWHTHHFTSLGHWYFVKRYGK